MPFTRPNAEPRFRNWRWLGLCISLTFVFIAPCFAQAKADAAGDSATSQPASKPADTPGTLKIGPLNVSISWRVRAEGWDWFQGNSGKNEYAYGHSLLRIGIGQNTEHFDWFLEGAQDAIVGLPSTAVAPGAQGQLGLGGTYFVANGNHANNVDGFLKQAYLRLKGLGPVTLQVGRFEFFDGVEAMPKDAGVAAVAQARVAQRLIGNFGWSAVQRSFDGVHLSIDSGANNFTFVAARPTEGVFQVEGMGELNIDLFYGSYNRQVKTKVGPGRLRVFGIGYLDDRNNVVKTDNRPLAVRTADHQYIDIGTYGADYLQIFDAHRAGKVDLVLWGALQNGSWGELTQRASAFITEVGWQPNETHLKPWFSLGVSRGSGDNNPSDSTHGTFFQILPTPRPFARFPFWNPENNEDFYGTLNLQPAKKLKLRSELHALRLANANDLWYSGGGAFQATTFGYTGRTSNGNHSLADVWDLSADYQITQHFGIGLYYGHAWGKAVIESIYPKNRDGQMACLETNVKF